MSEHPLLFTIGHSTRTLDEFVSLLNENDISAIADVRSSPFSRHMPHFNRDTLQESLKTHGIQYVFSPIPSHASPWGRVIWRGYTGQCLRIHDRVLRAQSENAKRFRHMVPPE